MREIGALYFEDIYDPRRKVSHENYRYLFVLIVLSPGFILLGSRLLVMLFSCGRSGDCEDFCGYDLEQVIWLTNLVFALVVSYFIVVSSVNRMRDSGSHWAWLLVPFVNLGFLLFKEAPKE